MGGGGAEGGRGRHATYKRVRSPAFGVHKEKKGAGVREGWGGGQRAEAGWGRHATY